MDAERKDTAVHKKSAKWLIVIFAALIFLPYPLWALSGGENGPFNLALNEKRELAERPAFQISRIAEMPGAYETYIDDHLPFRSLLSGTYSRAEYGIFHSSAQYMVIFGKDNWVFHSNRGDGDPIGLYKGTFNIKEAQLEQVRENLVATRDRLAEQGIDFVLFLTPLKERIYYAYLPDYYGMPAEDYALLRITSYLQATTDLKIVNATDALSAARDQCGEDVLLYHKTDSHWNELGAYIGTCELLKEMGISMLPYDSGEVTIKEKPDADGDMLNIANLEGVIDPGMDYTVTGYDRHNVTCDGGDFDSVLRYHATGADPRKVMVYHDSFAGSMLTVFSSQFDETVYVHRLAFSPDMVETDKPDVFVMEVAERNVIGGLSYFRYH